MFFLHSQLPIKNQSPPHGPLSPRKTTPSLTSLTSSLTLLFTNSAPFTLAFLLFLQQTGHSPILGQLHWFSLPGMLFCLKYYLRREALSTTSLPVLLCLHNTSHSLAVYNLCVCIFLSEIKHHGGRYFTSLFIAICPVPHTKLGVYQEQIKFIC